MRQIKDLIPAEVEAWFTYIRPEVELGKRVFEWKYEKLIDFYRWVGDSEDMRIEMPYVLSLKDESFLTALGVDISDHGVINIEGL